MMTLILAVALQVQPAATAARPPREAHDRPDWTVVVYGASDNDSERSFVPDMADLIGASRAAPGVQLVLLVDRSPRYSERAGAFGEDFADTRLFHAAGGEVTRLDVAGLGLGTGQDASLEADTGSAETLAAVLRFARERYPARHTALVFYSHGGGWSFCPDETSDGSRLYTAELSEALGEELSVDLLVFDVCSMAAVENAYQWRPGNGRFSASYLVATPNAGYPFPWPRIVAGLGSGEGPQELSPEAFGRRIVSETEAFRREELAHAPDHADELGREAMACLDLSQAAAVKQAVDLLAVALAASDAKEALEALRGDDELLFTMNYMLPEPERWERMPYFDLFDLARRIVLAGVFDEAVVHAAEEVLRTTEALVVASFGMGAYEDFEPGKNGVYLSFPDGDGRGSSGTHWSRMRWYGPDRQTEGDAYGAYAWCRDGATRGDGVVQNWFELLDRWFDGAGDTNGYRP